MGSGSRRACKFQRATLRRNRHFGIANRKTRFRAQGRRSCRVAATHTLLVVKMGPPHNNLAEKLVPWWRQHMQLLLSHYVKDSQARLCRLG